MRKHERKRERERERENIKWVDNHVEHGVSKVKYTGGMVCRDRDVRTCMRIRNTVHDR